jgi:hypothetical protein
MATAKSRLLHARVLWLPVVKAELIMAEKQKRLITYCLLIDEYIVMLVVVEKNAWCTC